MARSAFLLRFLILAPFCVIGCGGQEPKPLHPLEQKPALRPDLAGDFDASMTGTISGRINWQGSKPEANSFRESGAIPGSFATGYDSLNRLLPRIDAKDNGVVDAIVFLRNVDPDRCRPWDLPAARIEMKSTFIMVDQAGEHVAGFVRAGDEIEMNSYGPGIESLRARGAAFFTLAFPMPDQPLRRTLSQPGLVELCSAVGHFWARSWLFVVEHPYYARTDESGNFTLAQVPDGEYELVCWLPDWRIERYERDPELLATTRVWFRKPMEKKVAVRVEKGRIAVVHFSIGLTDFGK